MEHPKKELIEGIADLFKDHEEAYVPGEWEAFSQQQQRKERKYPFFGQWVKIAAALVLILAAVVYSLTNRTAEKQEIVIRKPQITLPEKNNAQPVLPADPKGTIAEGPIAVAGAEDHQQQAASSEQVKPVGPAPMVPGSLNAKSALPVAGQGIDPLVNKLKDAAAPLQKADAPVYAQAKEPVIPAQQDVSKDSALNHQNAALSTIDFLMAESKKPAAKEKKKETGPKWDFGVEVMPSVTQKNMNVGAGLTTAYRLSNKLSLSSGISLLQLQSGVSVGGNTVADLSATRALSDKELTSVSASLKAIDIPLGLVYKVNKHFYTSAGVSYFNVINEKRSNTYSKTSQVNQSVSNAITGDSYSYKAVVSEQVSEATPEEPLRGNSYLGFFNFSIGREQTLFNKYNIRIEPFIKVPVGKLSDQELKLMNSGLKLQLSF